MPYFIGIVPPENLLKKLIDVKSLFKSDFTEPHITVKAQSGLTEDMVWLDNIVSKIETLKPFDVTIGKFSSFNQKIIHYSIDSAEIKNIHLQLLNEFQIEDFFQKTYFEGDLYNPHLTLGYLPKPVDAQTLKTIEKNCAEVLGDFEPTFTVECLRIYKKPPNHRYYEPMQDVSFTAR